MAESNFDRAIRFTEMLICAVIFVSSVAFGWHAVNVDAQGRNVKYFPHENHIVPAQEKIHRYEPSITDEKDVRLFVATPPHEYVSGKIVPRVQ